MPSPPTESASGKRYLAKAGLLAWSGWVLLDYLAHHPNVTNALTGTAYYGWIIGFLLLGGGAAYLLRGRETVAYRGILVFAGVQLLASLLLLAFGQHVSLPGATIGTRIFYFAGYGTLHLLGLLLIFTLCFAVGNLLLGQLRERIGRGYELVATVSGTCLVGTVLVLLGLFNVLLPLVLWPLVVGVLGWQWRPVLAFLKTTLWEKRQATLDRWWSPLVVLLIGLVTAFNYIGAFKTFPIGYDGGALYVNLARLVAEGGGLPFGGQAFNWSVFMGFGQILFGSLTVAILLSHLMNVGVALLVYRLGREWLRPAYARLAVLIPLLSPYFSFHGIIDEKVDLGFTFIVLGTFLLLTRLFGGRSADGARVPTFSPDRLALLGGRWRPTVTTYGLLVAGFGMGYAFGIKYTAILFVLAAVCWLFYLDGRRWAFAGGLLGGLGLIFLGGIYRFGYVEIERGSSLLLGGVLVLAGGGALFLAYRKELSTLGGGLLRPLLLGTTFLLAFAPWAARNLSEHGSFSVGNLIEGRTAGPELKYLPGYSEVNPAGAADWSFHFMDYVAPQPQPEPDGRNATSSAAREEIQRYFGYEPVFWRYLSLPYDLTTNHNLPNSRYLNVTFLFLLLLPILIWTRPARPRPLWHSLLLLLGVTGYVAGAYYSMYATAGQNFDVASILADRQQWFGLHPGGSETLFWSVYSLLLSGILHLAAALSIPFALLAGLGMAPTVIVQLLLLLATYLLLRPRLKNWSVGQRAFAGFLAGYGLFWWLLGNGIIWYGMPLFVALPILLLTPFDRPARFLGAGQEKFTRFFAGGVFGIFLLLGLTTQFTSAFPGEGVGPDLFRWPFVDVATNPNSRGNKAIDRFNPVINQAMRIINSDPEANVYRVNTHYGFLIDRNDRRVFSDPVLERFDEISSRLADPSNFFDILKAQGFRYILFDLRTAMNDNTPEKSLQAKFIRFATQVTTSDKVKVLVTDNLIEDPANPGGKTQGLIGTTVSLGTVALLEIR